MPMRMHSALYVSLSLLILYLQLVCILWCSFLQLLFLSKFFIFSLSYSLFYSSQVPNLQHLLNVLPLFFTSLIFRRYFLLLFYYTSIYSSSCPSSLNHCISFSSIIFYFTSFYFFYSCCCAMIFPLIQLHVVQIVLY